MNAATLLYIEPDTFKFLPIIWIFIIIIHAVIWGVICQAVGKSKNVNGFWWGFFLGLIGLIVVICSKNVTNNNSSETKFDKYEQIEKLSKLKDSGAISKEEFEIEKMKLLK